MEKDFGAGTGEAFKSMNGGSSNGRRKRSIMNEDIVLKSIFRTKRQAEEAAAAEAKEKSIFQRIKEQFNHIMDIAQEIFQKIQKMGQSNTEAA